MLKEAVYVHTLGNHYLLDALVMHIYKNVFFGNFYHNKKVYVVSLYRSPSQTSNKFDSFINNFDKLVIDIYSRKAGFILVIGDFNTKSYNRSINDTTTPEGAQLDSITYLYGMKQLNSEPTHILQESSSCIDLIFTSKPITVMD